MAGDRTDFRSEFRDRHIGPDAAGQAEMLKALGLASLEALADRAVPASIRFDSLEVGSPVSEADALARLRALSQRNEVFTSLIGLGYHGTVTPPVILRNVLEEPGWYTAYTPYQPEISQGRLEALLNFQTMVADLTGMDIANSSLLDEATAAAEAMTMLHRLNPKAGETFLVDTDTHPQTVAVLRTRAEPLGFDVVVGDASSGAPRDGVFGALLSYPGSSGRVRDIGPEIRTLHDHGTLVAVTTDLLALCLLTPPGELGADVVVGSSQRFGVPLGFGGPHAAFLAAREPHKRTLPGRLVGVSVDASGRPAYRLALQTREQHIRREKATSNICTAQVLLAVLAGFYAVWHGPEGLRAIASQVHARTAELAAALAEGGFAVANTGAFFDTLTVAAPGRADTVVAAARDRRINLRLVDGDTVAVSLDETTDRDVVAAVVESFGLQAPPPTDAPSGLPEALRRTSEFCTHEVFNSHHSETDMLRYVRRLRDKDFALDRGMIPLGSCTMKLNATTEMIPVTWPAFGAIHPFAPLEQAQGYLEMIRGLEAMLVEITGYDAVSLQPNAGSQGEYAGLLAVRAYHRSRGESHRDVCLIPASAHGTNAATAAMAGMKVVVVACDDGGNVDVADLRAKAAEHGADLAVLMVTYPSTHGVYEEAIGEICAVVHDHGGQVYVDGANLNALVGLAKPGRFGADVSHLNLHKTFCIPHGGGGPGVGPIGVRAHLAPFLPNHPLVAEAGPASGIGSVAAAPWGSASILPISWAYITMMGSEGMRDATRVAVLAANYVAHRLAPHYPVLYTGAHGLVAHECILDLRTLSAETGVSVDDVAKRLIDYGFHAPTMSFPVAGTLMVEPTESESKEELDRFCDAMIAIRAEIDRVAAGEWPADDNPLAGAPHPAADVVADEWPHPYPRELAAYPVSSLHADKYWPPVSRIDGAYGDRHLFCSCPPLESDG